MTHLKQIIESMESGDMRSMGSSVHDLVAQKCQERFKPIYECANMKIENIKILKLSVARWKDTNGDKFFTFFITLNGKTYRVERNVHGSKNNKYKQIALEKLQNTDLIPTDVKSLTNWSKKNDIEFIYSVIDVDNKRDMVNFKG